MSNEGWKDSGPYQFEIVKAGVRAPGPKWIQMGQYEYCVVKVGGAPGYPRSAAFDEIAERYKGETMRLRYLRRSFQAAAAELAKGIADIYTRFQDKGDFKAVEIREHELHDAFKEGAKAAFKDTGLESFPGKYKGVNKHWKVNPDGAIEEIAADAKTWYMTWEEGVTISGDRYYQRVVGSMAHHYGSGELPPLGERKVDLALNVYSPEVGITGWLSTWVEFRTEMALISYELHTGEFMWIGQVLDDKLNPAFGENAFWIFLEWIRPAEKAYYMYGVQLEIDFDTPSVKLLEQGFRKTKFKRVG